MWLYAPKVVRIKLQNKIIKIEFAYLFHIVENQSIINFWTCTNKIVNDMFSSAPNTLAISTDYVPVATHFYLVNEPNAKHKQLTSEWIRTAGSFGHECLRVHALINTATVSPFAQYETSGVVTYTKYNMRL